MVNLVNELLRKLERGGRVCLNWRGGRVCLKRGIYKYSLPIYIHIFISELLSLVSRLDQVVKNLNLQQDWGFHKNLIKKNRNDPEKTTEEFQQERNLEEFLLKIEKVVINGKMLEYVTSLRKVTV